jgi:signal transduction histidine kinase/CheY-like chemotaxis protein
VPQQVDLVLSEFAIAQLGMQTAVYVAFSAVLFGLRTVYGRPFLLHWALGWLALALSHMASVGAAFTAGAGRLSFEVLEAVGACGQVLFLVSGTWLLVRGRERAPRWLLPLASLAVAAGLGVALGTLAVTEPARTILRNGILDGITGLAFLVTGAGVWRAARADATMGQRLSASFLAATGAAQVVELGLRLRELLPAQPRTTNPLGWFALSQLPAHAELLLQTLLLLAVVLWFFEADRQALVRTSAALAKSQEHLRRSEHMEAVGRLAGGIAHDFNNQLTAIGGHTELLLEQRSPDDPDRADLEPIARAAARSAELVHELLAFARRQPRSPRAFSLDALLSDRQRTLARLIGENVALELDLGASDAAVFADPGQVESVLFNLAVNARDAIDGAGKLALRTRAVAFEGDEQPGLAAGAYIELEVADSGRGLSPEAQAHLFEPFFTTKPDRGTGLGLASAYGILQQSGGDIHVESRPGGGTTFRLWLPRAGIAPESTRELVPAEAPRGGSETVVLVEDEPSVRALAQRVLARAGYRVLAAGDATEARERVRTHGRPVELLLCDVVMPGRPASELAAELRARDPALRVLWTSAHALQRNGSPAEPFLPKPFTSLELLTAVRAALDRRVGVERA